MDTAKVYIKNDGNCFAYVYSSNVRTWGTSVDVFAVIPCDGKEYELDFPQSTYLRIAFLNKYLGVSWNKYNASAKTVVWWQVGSGTYPTLEPTTTEKAYRNTYKVTYNGETKSTSVSLVERASSETFAYNTYVATSAKYITITTNAETNQYSDDLGISDVVIDGGGADPTITINKNETNSTIAVSPSEPTFSDTVTFTCTPSDNFNFNVDNVPYLTKTVGEKTETINGTLNDDGTATITVTFDSEADTVLDVHSTAYNKNLEIIFKNIGNAFVYLIASRTNKLADIANNESTVIDCIPYDGEQHIVNVDTSKYQYVIPFILRKYMFTNEGDENTRTGLFDWIAEQYNQPDTVALTEANYIAGYRTKLSVNGAIVTVDGTFTDSENNTQSESNDNGTCVGGKFSDYFTTLATISALTVSNYVTFNCACPVKQTLDDLGILQYITVTKSTVENSTVAWTPIKPSFSDTLVITCVADEGYHFSVTPYATVDYTEKVWDSDNNEYTSNTVHNVIDGVMDSEGNVTITVTFVAFAYTTVGISAFAIADETGATGYLYQLFKVSETNIQAIANTRYVLETLSTGDTETIDIGKYINSLKKFYCNVPTTTKQQSILLGTYKVDTKAPLVNNEIFDIDCGSIAVEEINKNNTDYTIDIDCYLPFIGLVTVDGSKLMGRTVNLTYSISAINGTCVAKFIYNDIVVATYEGSIAIDLPYITYGDEGNYNNQIVNNANILYGFVPYVVLNYYPNYNPNGSTLMNDDRYTRIGDLEGFNMVSDIDFVGLDIPSNEIDMIEEILEGGIYI